MKRSPTTSKSGGYKNKEKKEEVALDWEVRPGGLLVQKRSAAVGASDRAWPMIQIKVSYDSYHHNLTIPAQSTFGDLKRTLASEIGLEPQEQRLLFRGKEKEDHEFLHIAGVQDMSKVILVEDPASKEKKLEEMKNRRVVKAYEAVAEVRAEVDLLSEKVVNLESAMQNGSPLADKEFVVLIELLMRQLVKLDCIEAEGEAKVQRRIEVHRIQRIMDIVDNLRARNCKC